MTRLTARLWPYELVVEGDHPRLDVYLATPQGERIPRGPNLHNARAAVFEAARLARLLPCSACQHESCGEAFALAVKLDRWAA